MAFSFQNGVITGPGGYSYDLNKYLQSALRGSGDTTGGIGALHSFYDDYATRMGYATNPEGKLLGTTRYLPGFNQQMTQLSNEAQAILPAIKSWWSSVYKMPGSTPPTTQLPATTTTARQQVSAPYPTATRAAQYGQMAGVPAGTSQAGLPTPRLPGLPGDTATGGFVGADGRWVERNIAGLPADFDVRLGSSDPAINRLVYGSNYFPGTDPTFQAVLARYLGQVQAPIDREAFLRMDPESQGRYRMALAEWYQNQANQPGGQTAGGGGRGQVYDQQRGRVEQRFPAAPGQTGVSAPPSGQFDQRSLLNGSAFRGGRPAPGQTMEGPGARIPEFWDYRESPEYQWRQKQAERAANRQLLARGRSNSTYGMNTLARLASDIAAEEVDKQYARALQANLINYGRDFTEDERDYSRFWGEDDREFNRNTLLAQLGQRAAELAAQQAIGYGRDSFGNIWDTARGAIGADQAYANALLNMLLGYGDQASRNEWAALNPLLGLLMQGGQNRAALWESLGGLPTNILALLALLGGRGTTGGTGT